MSDGEYSRSASRMMTCVPVALWTPVRTAAPLPRFVGWHTVVTPRSVNGRSSCGVVSVLPSSTTMSSIGHG